MLQYLKKYRRECVCAPLFKMFEALLDLFVPLVVASIIDRGISAGSAGHVWRMSGLLVALGLAGLAAAVTAQYFAAKAATGFAADARRALFEKLTSLAYADVDRLGTSAMITRMTSDVNQAQTGVNMALRLLLRSPFVVLGAMVMAFTIDARCALFFALGGGTTADACRATMTQISPIHYAQPGRDFPPFLMLHGDADPVVLFEDTQRLYQRLIDLGYEADLVRVTGAEHEGSFWSEALLEIIFAFIQEKIGN